jgi:hypothetical protein
MGSVIRLEKRLAALEASRPPSNWDLDRLSDDEANELVRVLADLEACGGDPHVLPGQDYNLLVMVQERCWLKG